MSMVDYPEDDNANAEERARRKPLTKDPKQGEAEQDSSEQREAEQEH